MTLKSRVAVGVRLISLAGLMGSVLYFLHVFLKTGLAAKSGDKEVFIYVQGILSPHVLLRPSGFIVAWVLLFILSNWLATLVCRRVE
jgi:hypothetical protein